MQADATACRLDIARQPGIRTRSAVSLGSRPREVHESFEEMVPADVLGKLPNLQYFASVSGGRIIKGRFPILDPDPPGAVGSAAPKVKATP